MKPVATDFQQFVALRAEARAGSDTALRKAAEQFEALFLKTLLKSMRDASFGDPIFGNDDQSEVYRDLADQQLALEVSQGPGTGLADLLVRQLGGGHRPSGPEGGLSMGPAPLARRRMPVENPGTGNERPLWQSPSEFVRRLWPYANRAADRLDVNPRALIAQAALETGWGRHVIADDSGRSSLNVFGVKANGGWRGESMKVRTFEYADGAARQELASFRAYPSLAHTFDDYAELLSKNPRYASALGRGDDVEGFAEALQASGYATDPGYAAKIKSLLGSDTMRKALESLKFGGLLPIDRDRGSL